tara:strand:- start:5650 stop:5916 length:267 start_codon:yes stop_codon:yes gene_type:complete
MALFFSIPALAQSNENNNSQEPKLLLSEKPNNQKNKQKTNQETYILTESKKNQKIELKSFSKKASNKQILKGKPELKPYSSFKKEKDN